jgi:hypothetical protein
MNDMTEAQLEESWRPRGDHVHSLDRCEHDIPEGADEVHWLCGGTPTYSSIYTANAVDGDKVRTLTADDLGIGPDDPGWVATVEEAIGLDTLHLRFETDSDLCSIEIGERGGWDVTLWNREGGHVVLANRRVPQEAEIMRNRIVEFLASWWPDSFEHAPTAEELVERDEQAAMREAHPHADVQNADADADAIIEGIDR